MDLNALLAQLKGPADTQGSEPAHSQAQASSYRQPYVSSPMMSPPLASPQPQSANPSVSGIMTPINIAGSDRAASDRTANLLNLLKFNQPASGLGVSGQASQVGRDKEATRIFSASTVEGLSTSSPANPAVRNVSLGVPASATRGNNPRPSGSETPSDLLLKLLNPGQASATGIDKSAEDEIAHDSTEPMGRQSSNSPLEPRLADTEALPSVSKGAFTYINPFEQLAASSPRNKPVKFSGLSGAQTPNIAINSDDVAETFEQTARSPSPPALPDGRTQIEALLGIGTGTPTETTVSQAMGELRQQADREAQEALTRANAEVNSTGENGTHVEEKNTKDMKELEDAVHEAAVEIHQELKDDNKKAALEAEMPAELAEAFEATIKDIVQETAGDGWESADAESAKEESDTGVRVFNFPMKPFVAIDLVRLPAPREIRQDIVMKIASMKKEFDQIDRTLASATSNYIVYAMAKGGGLRIIRQEDGANKQVFRKPGNDIYNVGISGPAASPLSKSAETVLATGVNGSVFWTSVSVSGGESFEDEDLDKKGFVFPPLSTPDDNTSGGQLKTRAKLSSRHPEFFAVSRGKAIHVIWPSIAGSAPYLNNKTRVVDSEKYLSERCLKIATGKSGKDFAFSEDDTIIVSLDKAGRLKFWDIREHTDPATGTSPSAYRHVETKTPSMMLATTSGAEKSWATSVLFVDKDRPMTKGIALRYLLVGSKQNHTLQLWDLGLGKPVQEINFPHDSETDAICSVSYHAKSGIIAVGHPTRNSVFFIYLSSPRYNLGSLSQAEFIQRLAAGDATLPKPESTAIMTGIRELSLAALGHLRSLEICEPSAAATKGADGGETLFELYVSHSRGVACLDIKRQDLGWDKDGKVLTPVNAAAEELIVVKELRLPQAGNEATESVDNQGPVSAADAIRKEEPKESAKAARAPGTVTKPSLVPTQSTAKSAISKSTKTDAARPVSSETQAQDTGILDVAPAPAKPADQPAEKFVDPVDMTQRSMNGNAAEEPVPTEDGMSSSMNIDAAQLGETISKALGNTLSAIFGNVLGEQLESLYKKIDEDKRVQEAAGAAKQDAILRLVSSTLTDNVEKSLTRIITTNIQQSLLPAINGITQQAVKEQLSASVPREIKASLQGPISKAMQEPEVLKSISDHVSGKIASHVETVFANTLSQKVAPAFQKLAVDTARKASSEVEARVIEQIQKVNVQWKSDSGKIDHLTKQHNSDSAKIDQLTRLTTEVLDTVRGMTKALADAQTEITNLKSQLAEREASERKAVSLPPVAAPRDEELEQLTETMASGRLAEGTIKWLQSARRVELFDHFFARYDPNYLKGVDQLITLSVSAAVTDSFDKNVAARLHWLEVALNAINAEDPVIAEHASKVMDILVQRLSDVYMAIAETEPADPMLMKIHALVRLAKVVKKSARRS